MVQLLALHCITYEDTWNLLDASILFWLQSILFIALAKVVFQTWNLLILFYKYIFLFFQYLHFFIFFNHAGYLLHWFQNAPFPWTIIYTWKKYWDLGFTFFINYDVAMIKFMINNWSSFPDWPFLWLIFIIMSSLIVKYTHFNSNNEYVKKDGRNTTFVLNLHCSLKTLISKFDKWKYWE